MSSTETSQARLAARRAKVCRVHRVLAIICLEPFVSQRAEQAFSQTYSQGKVSELFSSDCSLLHNICPWVVERVNVVQIGGAQQSEDDSKVNAPSGTTKPPTRLD